KKCGRRTCRRNQRCVTRRSSRRIRSLRRSINKLRRAHRSRTVAERRRHAASIRKSRTPARYRRVRVKHACEGKSLTIRCPSRYVIRVLRGFYGRTSNKYCARGPRKTYKCSSGRANKVIASKCNNRRACRVRSNNAVFGDPCRGTYKYMTVRYRCQLASSVVSSYAKRRARLARLHKRRLNALRSRHRRRVARLIRLLRRARRGSKRCVRRRRPSRGLCAKKRCSKGKRCIVKRTITKAGRKFHSERRRMTKGYRKQIRALKLRHVRRFTKKFSAFLRQKRALTKSYFASHKKITLAYRRRSRQAARNFRKYAATYRSSFKRAKSGSAKKRLRVAFRRRVRSFRRSRRAAFKQYRRSVRLARRRLAQRLRSLRKKQGKGVFKNRVRTVARCIKKATIVRRFRRNQKKYARRVFSLKSWFGRKARIFKALYYKSKKATKAAKKSIRKKMRSLYRRISRVYRRRLKRAVVSYYKKKSILATSLQRRLRMLRKRLGRRKGRRFIRRAIRKKCGKNRRCVVRRIPTRAFRLYRFYLRVSRKRFRLRMHGIRRRLGRRRRRLAARAIRRNRRLRRSAARRFRGRRRARRFRSLRRSLKRTLRRHRRRSTRSYRRIRNKLRRRLRRATRRQYRRLMRNKRRYITRAVCAPKRANPCSKKRCPSGSRCVVRRRVPRLYRRFRKIVKRRYRRYAIARRRLSKLSRRRRAATARKLKRSLKRKLRKIWKAFKRRGAFKRKFCPSGYRRRGRTCVGYYRVCPRTFTMIRNKRGGRCIKFNKICKSGKFLFNNRCWRKCPRGTRRSSRRSCKRKRGCKRGLVYYSGSCRSKCPSGTRRRRWYCLKICKKGFMRVGFRRQRCIRAYCYNKFRIGRSCVRKCPVGYIGIRRKCRRVSISCPKAYVRLGRALCLRNCPAGFTKRGKQCAYSACRKGTYRYRGTCMKGCPAGTKRRGSYCFKRSKCRFGRFAYGKRCLVRCPPGHYRSFARRSCVTRLCPSGRLLLIKPSGARSCVRACPRTYTVVRSRGSCKPTRCPKGMYRLGITCRKSCPKGFRARRGRCRAVRKSCKRRPVPTPQALCEAMPKRLSRPEEVAVDECLSDARKELSGSEGVASRNARKNTPVASTSGREERQSDTAGLLEAARRDKCSFTDGHGVATGQDVLPQRKIRVQKFVHLAVSSRLQKAKISSVFQTIKKACFHHQLRPENYETEELQISNCTCLWSLLPPLPIRLLQTVQNCSRAKTWILPANKADSPLSPPSLRQDKDVHHQPKNESFQGRKASSSSNYCKAGTYRHRRRCVRKCPRGYIKRSSKRFRMHKGRRMAYKAIEVHQTLCCMPTQSLLKGLLFKKPEVHCKDSSRAQRSASATSLLQQRMKFVERDEESAGQNSLTLNIHGLSIRLHQKRRVFFNGKRVRRLPVSLYKRGKKLRVYRSGNNVVVESKYCGLYLEFNGRSVAELHLPKSRFAGKVQGICGNCNGNPKDDLKTRSGKDVSKLGSKGFVQIGQSYLVADRSTKSSRCKVKPASTSKCSKSMKRKIKSSRFCGLISNKKGPFRACLKSGKVDYTKIYKSCKFDVCQYRKAKNRRKAVCESLETLYNACLAKGFRVSWRKRRFCPLKCGANSVFRRKTSGCPRTCADLGRRRKCRLPSREGCACKEGYVLNGKKCVPERICGKVVPLDLAFVVDGTDDVSSDEFETLKNLIIKLLTKYRLSSNSVRPAIAVFGRTSPTVSLFNQRPGKADFMAFVRKMKKPGGSADNLDAALRVANKVMMNPMGGARPAVPKYILLLKKSKVPASSERKTDTAIGGLSVIPARVPPYLAIPKITKELEKTAGCTSGYKRQGKRCIDVNECAAKVPPCHSDSTCVNLPGSFICLCREGFRHDRSRGCVSLKKEKCPSKPKCDNGYRFDKANGKCVDINECKENPCLGDSATCVNTPGSFKCKCKTGFEYNKYFGCVDIDECKGKDPCAGSGKCINTLGSFKCTCDEGYTYKTGLGCKDIDECAAGSHNCKGGSKCINTAGSYNCSCDSGYRYESNKCIDIDECAEDSKLCDASATCVNKKPGYECQCKLGSNWVHKAGRGCVPDEKKGMSQRKVDFIFTIDGSDKLKSSEKDIKDFLTRLLNKFKANELKGLSVRASAIIMGKKGGADIKFSQADLSGIDDKIKALNFPGGKANLLDGMKKANREHAKARNGSTPIVFLITGSNIKPGDTNLPAIKRLSDNFKSTGKFFTVQLTPAREPSDWSPLYSRDEISHYVTVIRSADINTIYKLIYKRIYPLINCPEGFVKVRGLCQLQTATIKYCKTEDKQLRAVGSTWQEECSEFKCTNSGIEVVSRKCLGYDGQCYSTEEYFPCTQVTGSLSWKCRCKLRTRTNKKGKKVESLHYQSIATSKEKVLTESGRQCVFPFKYQNKWLYNCDEYNGRYWCSYHRMHETGSWGYCKIKESKNRCTDPFNPSKVYIEGERWNHGCNVMECTKTGLKRIPKCQAADKTCKALNEDGYSCHYSGSLHKNCICVQNSAGWGKNEVVTGDKAKEVSSSGGSVVSVCVDRSTGKRYEQGQEWVNSCFKYKCTAKGGELVESGCKQKDGKCRKIGEKGFDCVVKGKSAKSCECAKDSAGNPTLSGVVSGRKMIQVLKVSKVSTSLKTVAKTVASKTKK
uniref:SUEL-type lectin domain-containing protein n=1 Tax=Macrostomum lignano TaxID=282301 RepID=A0A1I8I5M9_9PLAT